MLDLRDKLIDAHVHVWTDDTAAYPLAPGYQASDLWRPHFKPEDHAAYSQRFGSVRLNLVQMIWYGLDHRYIVDLIAAAPDRFVGTGVVPAYTDVALPSPDKMMLTLARQGIYAFRVRGGPPGWLEHEGYHTMFQTGAEHNLALSFLAGLDVVPDLERMCTRYPDTPVILDHLCGLWRQPLPTEANYQLLLRMAKHRRVMVKLGPFQALGNRQCPYLDLLPLIRRIVDAFGPQRCMWESDSGGPIWMPEPVENFPAAIDLIRDHADFLSDADKQQILYQTAEDFFFKR
jgi:predicted TIM-barrel fold metal-dependent hydrolase